MIKNDLILIQQKVLNTKVILLVQCFPYRFGWSQHKHKALFGELHCEEASSQNFHGFDE